MKLKFWLWLIFALLFLFFLFMFYIEVSLYSFLPPDRGGMSFLMELKNAWYGSVWFYAMVMMVFLLFYFSFFKKRE